MKRGVSLVGAHVRPGSAAAGAGGRIPATLLTGFLGSGKTTLLNHLLQDPEMADTAVVINEFGDVAIDHLLVESSIENAVVLQSGCICCTVRGDLVDTLTDLLAKRRRGDIPHFTRIAIETTGLADPSPIVQSLATERLLVDEFCLRAVVTTVDAVNGFDQLDSFPEAARQAALADVLILTKTDIVREDAVAPLKARLKRMNPPAAIVEVVHGRLSAQDLFDHAPQLPAEGGTIGSWLKAEAFEAGETQARTSVHDAAIRSFSITTDNQITPEGLRGWLASITSLRGADLLRMKGIVAVRGLPGPVVIHAVQHIVHPPVRLPAWPSVDRTTRIVFITRGLAPEGLRRSFQEFGGSDEP